jgi:hypothetical protein
MLKQRRRAVDLVTTDFLAAESAADGAAAAAAACVATMLRQRAEAGLPVGTGLAALQLVTEAAADLVRARQRLIEAHGVLLQVRTDIGVHGYGDISECPKLIGTDEHPVRLSAVA